jgi:hypothetical protein
MLRGICAARSGGQELAPLIVPTQSAAAAQRQQQLQQSLARAASGGQQRHGSRRAAQKNAAAAVPTGRQGDGGERLEAPAEEAGSDAPQDQLVDGSEVEQSESRSVVNALGQQPGPDNVDSARRRSNLYQGATLDDVAEAAKMALPLQQVRRR